MPGSGFCKIVEKMDEIIAFGGRKILNRKNDKLNRSQSDIFGMEKSENRFLYPLERYTSCPLGVRYRVYSTAHEPRLAKNVEVHLSKHTHRLETNTLHIPPPFCQV